MKIKEVVSLDKEVMEVVIKNEIESVFPTLSISLYLGRALEGGASLVDEQETSFYSPVKDMIVISSRNVTTAIDEAISLAKGEYLELSIEELVRTVLYHEVSHAILTPPDLMKNFRYMSTTPAIANIVEDQRIETLCERFFHKAEFRKFRELLIPETVDPSNTEYYTCQNLFLCFVRRGDTSIASKKTIDLLIDTLVKGKAINGQSRRRNTPQYQYYVTGIMNTWESFREDFLKAQAQQSQQKQSQKQSQQELPQNTIIDAVQGQSGESQEQPQGQSQGQSQQGQSQEDKDSQEQSQQGQSGKSQEQQQKDSQTQSQKDSQEQSQKGQSQDSGSDKSDDIYKELGDNYSLNPEDGTLSSLTGLKEQRKDVTLEREFNRIFSASEKRKNLAASARDAYSGRLNVKAFATETQNNGKIFIRPGDGYHKGSTKYHLNLFLDESGSMSKNVVTINKLITALNNTERKIKDFSWTWIACENGQKIYSKNEEPAEYVSKGGTWLTGEIWGQFKAVQRRDAANLNVVLYDGAADGEGNWAVFNRRDCIVVTDTENEYDIRRAWGKKKPQGEAIIIDGNYAEELINVLIKHLGILINKI